MDLNLHEICRPYAEQTLDNECVSRNAYFMNEDYGVLEKSFFFSETGLFHHK